MAERDFLLPDLGEGLTEGEIVRWLVAVGDTVVVDQPVVEIETAKAIVEVPSPFAGVVTTLHGAEGEEVRVGAPLLTVDVAAAGSPGGAGTSATGTRAGAAVPAKGPGSVPDEAEAADLMPEPAAHPAAQPVAETANGASGSVLVGYGTSGGVSRRRRARNGSPVATPAATSAPPAPAADTSAPDTPAAGTSAPAAGAGPLGPEGRPLAKPPVRKLAKDLGVDLRAVRPTGHGGVITREDVQVAADHATVGANGNGAALMAPTPADRRVPLRGVRKRIAERMTTSRREIPEAATWVDCDATELMRLRDEINAAQADVRVSPLALVLRIVVAGLQEFPQLNASLDGEDIVLHGAVHLGVAAQTERGLVVPVIRDAHGRSTLRLAAELNRLAEGARAGTLSPAELSGSTFTVSNYGSFGVDGGNPVINHPEAAILGVGRITDRPWVHEGALAVRKVLQLSIAFDHRIADGGEAAGFLRYVADRVEHPARLLADL